MNEQRLERALRAGPPFATSYQPATLVLPRTTPRHVFNARAVLSFAVLALLVAVLIAALAVGTRGVVVLGLSCGDAGEAVAAEGRGWERPGVSLALVGGPGVGMVAVVDEDGELSLVDAATGATCAALRYADQPGAWISHAEWSPDGGALAFVIAEGDATGQYALLVLSRGGLSRNVLSSQLPIDFAWSPDGRSLAVITTFSRHAATPVDVWVVSAAGGAPRPMRFDCEGCADEPPNGIADGVAWSPDGSRLAVAFLEVDDLLEDDVHAGFHLWVGSVHGGRLERLPGDPNLTFEHWLDDGALLARTGEVPETWLSVDVSDGTRTPTADAAPSFGASPDGRYDLQVTSLGSLIVIDVIDGSSRALVPSAEARVSVAIWSPDSSAIAYGVPDDPDDPEKTTGVVWITSIDGQMRRQLGGAGLRLLGSATRAVGPWQPTWRP